ncbi:uncharacterized protein UTRI_01285 [Ustilago trichophora]|uniref:Uncharacterized protein n=1 Tax=Ustilago trichophora TaxID=86804 RepID=A0A5C3DZ75_9BASI|nr:uncharacterized protein UTRI_01285 [Ustilago trichophora]
MRRPAPPPPADEVVDLDYGSADVPTYDGAKQLVKNEPTLPESSYEVGASTKPTHSPPISRGRKLLAYETDDADQPVQRVSAPLFQTNAFRSHNLEYGDSSNSSSVDAVAGPSSPTRQQTAIAGLLDSTLSQRNGNNGSSANLLENNPPQHPPAPAHLPPAFPHEQEHHRSYAYDPSAPEFRPSLLSTAPPTLHAEAIPYYPASAPQSFHYGSAESYVHPSGSNVPYPAYDPPYDPYAPLDPYTYGAAQQYGHPFPPYPPTSTYASSYPADLQYGRPASQAYPQMSRYQEKRLLKQQKKKEKKLRKRERKQAALEATTAISSATSGEHYSDYANADYANADAANTDLAWVENGKAQAVEMIKELHARGVSPERLTEKGVPLSAIEACCAGLGIFARRQATQEAENTSTSPQQATSTADSAERKNQVATTPAEDELLVKQEQGIALTPLEELRKKVLASRLAKAAAASNIAKPAEAQEVELPAAVKATDSSTSSATLSVFDRTATSGEADALLSQIGETIRSLLRPSQETASALWSADPPIEPSQDPAPSSRKRPYRDVDAVDNDYASVTADLAGEDVAEAPAPSRRQRISYADNFSRKAEMPSGEVDLTAPVPDLPDFSESAKRSSVMADVAVRRRRPVAADFDTAEYRPQFVRPYRFLDVPSGLNTVIDLSDDEMEDKELGAFKAADGWMSAQLDVDPRDVLMLRQKTASEHYDNFCTLNGLQPVRRAITPQNDNLTEAVEAAEATTPGGSLPREALLAQVAASGATSAGSSTPSREQLLLKELEIKQLMRKIQMMEERKSKQNGSLSSPSVSPMPALYAQVPLNAQQQQPTDGAMLFAPEAAKVSEAACGPAESVKREVAVQPPAQASGSAPVPNANGSSGGSNNLRLDPALQKQRENLLALLASKRKNVGASATDPAPVATQPGNIDQTEAPTPARTQEEASPEAQNAATAELPQSESLEDQNKVSSSPLPKQLLHEHFGTIDAHSCPPIHSPRPQLTPQPSVVSRYRPLVPSLFQSVATKFRSYLPPSLGFSVGSSSSSSSSNWEEAEERSSVKWCPREADGHSCADSGCSQRHVAGKS